VADHDNAKALFLEAPDELEDLLRLGHAEGGGRLVEKHHLGGPHH
jgi:hypothetical protein